MATLVLSAAGAAFGGGMGGSLLGVTTMALGKAAGAALGSIVDQRLLGAGAAPVETGKIDRFRVMGSSEGTPLPRCFGRVRLPGQIIWSSRFWERISRQNVGGKGGRGEQKVRRYSYSISLALALCEGEVYRVGRIWADGQPVDQSTITWRLHKGSEDQEPDPVIAAIEGQHDAPAHRGTAYVVIEDLDLSSFGNRIPQFNFEVFRRPKVEDSTLAPALKIQAVALVPGTGEYALATEPVVIEKGRGEAVVVNVNNDRGAPDVVASLDQLEAELPKCEAVSLVVSWFADDLRVDRCSLFPAVEQNEVDGREIPWRVAGVSREAARRVGRVEDRPLFGGTPSDATVVQAIRHMKASEKAVMFYPFILLDILRDSGLEDPWNPGSEQPAVPWRGRMTLSRAPGVPGTPDQTAAAAHEVGAFLGTAEPEHFRVLDAQVVYSGPQEWSYRRFVLHYAALCAAAGGVDSFCIGTEMRSLTQIRDGRVSYPFVRGLRRLARDVRAILGPGTKIGYAADWSEYFGHQPADGSGDVIFHLDELWADPEIGFVGIDNYMPLSDWRDGTDHLDAEQAAVYNIDYLRANVAGGEGFDWYYPDATARELQLREPITDGAYGEPWIYRYKDLRNWWSNLHYNRIGGTRAEEPTGWVPHSKPFWFTEIGCPAVDKGANQPNVFFDPKSSESLLPHFSSGVRDDLIQQSYLGAVLSYWSDVQNNPLSPAYPGKMVDTSRCFVWAWDARPWPDFPLRTETWVDGPNYRFGHWLNGRIGAPAVADIVAEICARADLPSVDGSGAHGLATGYAISEIQTARQSLQPLLLAHALDVSAAGDRLTVRARRGRVPFELIPDQVVFESGKPRLEHARSAPAELPTRVSLAFVRADSEYQPGVAEAVVPHATGPGTTHSAVALVLPEYEAQAAAERWLHESRVAQDSLSWTAAPSSLPIGVGDSAVLKSGGSNETYYRIDRIVDRGAREITAVKFAPTLYEQAPHQEQTSAYSSITAPSSAHIAVLDLPLLVGDEQPHAPHVAALRKPWLGPIPIYMRTDGSDQTLACTIDSPTAMGRLLDPLPAGDPGLWMPSSIRVRMDWGLLSSRSELEVLNGANAAALKSAEGSDLEIIQFREAHLVAPSVYQLSGFLRGQAGTDFCIPPQWPTGTDFFLLDGAQKQVELRRWRKGLRLSIGTEASLGEHSSGGLDVEAYGAGLRPYRPVHLNVSKHSAGDLRVSWIRRTRLEGDNWDVAEVPIGEEGEVYHVRLFSGVRLLRAEVLSQPSFLYKLTEQVSDGLIFPLTVEVAQVSARFGEGPASRIIVDG